MSNSKLTLVYFTRPQACPQCRAWEMVGITSKGLAKALSADVAVVTVDPANPGQAYRAALTQVIAPQSVPSLYLWDGARAVQIAPRCTLDSTPSLREVVAIIREESAKWA